MDSGKSARARALLGLGGAGAVGTLGAGKDATRSNDQDVAVRELLLELTGEAVRVRGRSEHNAFWYIPLLRLVPARKERDRDEDDNGLPAVTDLNLRILVSAFCSCPVPTASSISKSVLCIGLVDIERASRERS